MVYYDIVIYYHMISYAEPPSPLSLKFAPNLVNHILLAKQNKKHERKKNHEQRKEQTPVMGTYLLPEKWKAIDDAIVQTNGTEWKKKKDEQTCYSGIQGVRGPQFEGW